MQRLILIFILLLPLSAQARSVSYPGGWTIMNMNNKDMNSLHLHYTTDPKNSIGWRH